MDKRACLRVHEGVLCNKGCRVIPEGMVDGGDALYVCH